MYSDLRITNLANYLFSRYKISKRYGCPLRKGEGTITYAYACCACSGSGGSGRDEIPAAGPRSVAAALRAGHPAAVVAVDRGGDRAAAGARADSDPLRADADGDARIPPIAIDPIIPVATDLHVDLRELKAFRLRGDDGQLQLAEQETISAHIVEALGSQRGLS